MFVFDRTIKQTKEALLDGFGEFTAHAGANDHFVHRADRGDFSGGTGEEDFVGLIQHFALHIGLAHFHLEFFGYRHD